VIDDEGADDWRTKLRELHYVEIITVPTKEGGSCRALEEEQPVLFYKKDATESAKKLEKDLSLEKIKLMEPGNNKCGKGELFAMPAKKAGFRETMKEKAEKAAEKVKGELPPLPKPEN
jgi:hypothetical protein